MSNNVFTSVIAVVNSGQQVFIFEHPAFAPKTKTMQEGNE